MEDTSMLSHMAQRLRQSSMPRGLGQFRLIPGVAPAAGSNFTRTVPAEYFERVQAIAFTFTTSAAAGTREPVINYLDGDGNIFNQVPVSGGISPSQAVTVFADQQSVTPIQQPATQQAQGQVTSPAAGAVIATLVLPGGDWAVNWQVEIEANGAAADDNNFALFLASASQLVSESGHVAGQPYPQEQVDLNLGAAGGTVTVKAVGIGTVTAVYVAQMAAVPVSQAGLQAQIPDFLLKSGWQLQLLVAGIQAGDTLTGIRLLLEQFPSDLASGVPHPDYERVLRELEHLAAG